MGMIFTNPLQVHGSHDFVQAFYHTAHGLGQLQTQRKHK